jgi:N-ethylmaleimide reductase
MGSPEVPASVIDAIRQNFTNTLILVGNYNAERGEEALASGIADLVAIGRPFIANPDLVDRLKNKLPLNQLKFDLFYTAGAEGYIDYPAFEDVMVTP